jgi:hypothetical protein
MRFSGFADFSLQRDVLSRLSSRTGSGCKAQVRTARQSEMFFVWFRPKFHQQKCLQSGHLVVCWKSKSTNLSATIGRSKIGTRGWLELCRKDLLDNCLQSESSFSSVGDRLNNWPADELSLTHNWANRIRRKKGRRKEGREHSVEAEPGRKNI